MAYDDVAARRSSLVSHDLHTVDARWVVANEYARPQSGCTLPVAIARRDRDAHPGLSGDAGRRGIPFHTMVDAHAGGRELTLDDFPRVALRCGKNNGDRNGISIRLRESKENGHSRRIVQALRLDLPAQLDVRHLRQIIPTASTVRNCERAHNNANRSRIATASERRKGQSECQL